MPKNRITVGFWLLVLTPIFTIAACPTDPPNPPCTFDDPGPMWTTPAPQCAPYDKWPEGLAGVQYTVEWAIYGSYVVFNALPPALQTECMNTYDSLLQAVYSADQTYIDFVNSGEDATSGQYQLAVTELLGAVAQLQTTVEDFEKTQSCNVSGGPIENPESR
jgi:hypothetical protein